MKLFILLLFSSSFAVAQDNSTERTMLNRFVEKPSVTWAAYVNDTTDALQTLMAKKIWPAYRAGKILGYLDGWRYGTSYENNPERLTASDFILSRHGSEDPIIDSEGNIPPGPKRDTAAEFASFLKVPVRLLQILYVEKDKLKSYIFRILPQIPVTTSQGLYLGTDESLSFCHNKIYDQKPEPGDELIITGRSLNMIKVDSIPKADRLKELYGQNLIEVLWKLLEQKKLQAFTAQTLKGLSIEEIKRGKIPGADSVIRYADDTIGVRYVEYKQYSAQTFDRIWIAGELIYDKTKNIMFCNLTEAILDKKIDDKQGNPTNEYRPMLRIPLDGK